MFRGILIFLIAIVATTSYAQSKSDVIDKGIKTVKVYEQKFAKGFDEKILLEETTYNSRGKVAEIKELDRKGIIKRWEKFKYDDNGNCIEEIYLNESGDIDKRVIIIYVNGLKSAKEYYNSEGNLYRKKTYEYQF